MDDRKRSREEALEYRIVVRLFASAFEACGRLPLADQQLSLREIAKRAGQQLPAAPPEEENAVKVIGVQIKQSP
jgi:hypothetical protein